MHITFSFSEFSSAACQLILWCCLGPEALEIGGTGSVNLLQVDWLVCRYYQYYHCNVHQSSVFTLDSDVRSTSTSKLLLLLLPVMVRWLRRSSITSSNSLTICSTASHSCIPPSPLYSIHSHNSTFQRHSFQANNFTAKISGHKFQWHNFTNSGFNTIS